ncbi:MAG: shikimate dehydrogenase family protein [Desulfomonilia bacterium]
MNITGKTRIVTILAHPSHHVQAPFIFNTLFPLLGMDMVYISHDIAPDAVRETVKSFIRWENLAGFNVTIPHKESVVEFLDVACPITSRIKVVNTVVRQKNGSLFGYNTDGFGALGALGEVEGENCLIIGAGGAARSIADALMHRGAQKIWIMNRSDESLQKFLALFSSDQVTPYDDRVLEEVDVLIQATPITDVIPFDLDLARLKKNVRILETVMQPTALAAAAREHNLRVIPGYAMLYHQTRRNFRLFTGSDLPSRHLEQAFRSVGFWPV